MSFESDLSRLTERIQGIVYEVMDDYGGILEDELAQTLNVAYPPPSQVGETPHRRTGALRAGLGHVTTAEGELVITEIFSSREPVRNETRAVPGILNFTLQRPYMTYMYQALASGKFGRDTIQLIINRVNSL